MWVKDKDGTIYIRELGAENNPKSRGMRIYSNGNIDVGYWNHRHNAPGNYIYIYKEGIFHVGECYRDKNGDLGYRGIQYKTDGTSN